jgi:hypothetical protein
MSETTYRAKASFFTKSQAYTCMLGFFLPKSALYQAKSSYNAQNRLFIKKIASWSLGGGGLQAKTALQLKIYSGFSTIFKK